MGRHFTSPRKAQDKKKSRITAAVPGHASKRQKLLDELGDLLSTQPSELMPSLNSGSEAASTAPLDRRISGSAPNGVRGDAIYI